ncbi:MAG: hypothetical protein HZC29_00225, partial [Thaumarchaeota archaeon]|nr:hypothetical protein [Nitrososphaerota archaeon]
MSNSCSVLGTDVNCAFGNLSQTSTSSQYNFRYHACADRVGNATGILDINFGVDWSAPTTSDDSTTTVQVPTYTVTLTEADNASNAGSNIVTVYCKDTDNSCTPSTGIDTAGTVNFTSSNRGVSYLRYMSTDLANNVQSVVSKTVNVNQLPVWGNAPGFDSNALKDVNRNNSSISCVGGRSIKFDANASDADSGQTLKLFVCSDTNASASGCGAGSTTACSSTGSSTNPSCTFAQSADNLSHTWYGFLFDSLNEQVAAGYIAAASYTCDSNLPVIAPSSPANASSSSDSTPTLTGVLIGSSDLNRCFVQIATDANFATIPTYNGASGTVTSGTTCTYTVPSALADGTYYWRMKGIDSVGNFGAYDVNYSLVIDTTTLATSLTSIASDSSSPYCDIGNDSQTSVVVAGESGMFCRWNTSDQIYSAMPSGNECSINGSNATCSLGSITQGSGKQYFVSCKDSTGNEQSTNQNIDLSFTV